MKKLIAVIILFLTIFQGTACSSKKSDAPGISLKFDVSNLTDEDFKAVGTKEVPGAVKEDFKNIASSSSTNINRYWFGKVSSQDNTNENFAKYTHKFVFYSKGLDEQGIKDLFKSAEVKVSWTSGSKNQERVLKLGDVIQIKTN